MLRIVFELQQSGGVLPSIQMDMFQPYPYESGTDIAKMSVEVVVLLMVLVYIFIETKTISKKGVVKYFTNINDVPHFANLIIFMYVYALRAYIYTLMPQ